MVGAKTERMGFEAVKIIHKKYGNLSETSTIGGKHCNFRSRGEKRLAQYLELLKIGGYIKDWAFEQTLFKTSDGDKFWLVDFDVLNNDGTFCYYEFKGMVKQQDVTKLQLLFETRPEVKLTMVFESRISAAKLARRKISRYFLIKILTARGLMEFDNRLPQKRKRK